MVNVVFLITSQSLYVLIVEKREIQTYVLPLVQQMTMLTTTPSTPTSTAMSMKPIELEFNPKLDRCNVAPQKMIDPNVYEKLNGPF